jgi:hypothetical protein
MDYRLPYYMAYPMPLMYDDERIERRDFEYMKSMYPMAVKRLLPYVEEECERMSYEGSMIYDEYPDQLQIRLMCGRICQRIKAQDEELEMQQLPELVHIMVCQELFRRRCTHRKNTRRIYY